ncbi:radical SAM protein [Candidatus Woesearchaeota archaeon]|nr:MAG: radical SAM protein [Candidatus Woesearchaeota archaeon]
MEPIIARAERVFLSNFEPKAWFERAIFYSWYCSVRDCAFCYMSSLPAREFARRSPASILAELLLCRLLGWRIGFISGGIGAFKHEEFFDLLKKMHSVAGEKLWLNVGFLDKNTLKMYQPYVKGVVASIECINPELHARVCPSKPTQPYEQMLSSAIELNLKTAITIIIGLGETKRDYPKLKRFLQKYRVSKIHFYCLNPQKGTAYENQKPPSPEEQAWWIAKTRIDFPSIDIQGGIWLDKVGRVGLLLKAGANSISKFPAIRYFGSPEARAIEQQAKSVGREFIGTLTKPPKVDVKRLLAGLEFESELKARIAAKLEKYLRKIKAKGF